MQRIDAEAASAPGPNGAGPHQEEPTPSSSLRIAGTSVSVRNVRKFFINEAGKDVWALDNVSLEVPKSGITALLGPSGSGKTTLLRIMAGLEEPTTGSVFFGDTDVTYTKVQDRRIGFVFQAYALFNHMSVAQNVGYSIRTRKLPIDEASRVQELLDLVELGHVGERYPRQLSGGQAQRIAVARALAANPRLLLLDEPFAALDPTVREALRKGLKKVIKKVGVTAIFVTHDHDEAFDMADEVVVFNKGNIIQQGPKEFIKKHPVNAFVMGFTGDVNKLPATHPFVRRMGFQTLKPMVMFQPESNLEAYNRPQLQEDGRPITSPVTIIARWESGYSTQYNLQFDDTTEIEWDAPLDNEGKVKYDWDVGQRIHIKLPPESFMDYHPSEIAAAN